MNQSNAKQFLPLVQALAEGKIIQHKNRINNQWKDMDCDVNIAFSGEPDRYRIKPEPVKVERWGVVSADGEWETSFPNENQAKDYVNGCGRGHIYFPVTGSYER